MINPLLYDQFMLNPGASIQARHACDYSGVSVGFVNPNICVVYKIFSPLFSYLILKTDLRKDRKGLIIHISQMGTNESNLDPGILI